MTIYKHREYYTAGSLTANPTSDEWNSMVDMIQDAGSGINSKHIIVSDSGSGYIKFPELSTVERDALASGSGMTIWNSDLLALQVYNGTTWSEIGGGAEPSGSDTYVQFNSDGSFAGDAGLTYDSGSQNLSVGNGASIPKLIDLTSNGFVKTTGADGTLSVDTSTYLTEETGSAIFLKLDGANSPMTGAVDLGSNLINNLGSPVSDQDAATKKYVDDTSEAASLWEVDGTETQLKIADEIDMQTKKIINLVDPTADQDASTKKYVDDSFPVTHASTTGQTTDDHHPQTHTIVSHDTTATGTELDTLTDDSMADTLHRHSELVASDESPDPAVSVDADGNVGIGTVDSSFNLHLNNPTSAVTLGFQGAQAGARTYSFTNAITGVSNIGFSLRDATNGVVEWYVNSDHNFIIPSGDVGIGTITPAHKLDVVGNIADDFVARVFNDGDNQNRDVLLLQGGSNNFAGNTKFIEFRDGNGTAVGFLQGGTPSEVDSGLQITAGATQDQEHLVIKPSGNVGIGTSAPTEKLDVVGNIRVPSTTFAEQYGIIYKGTIPFIHDFSYGLNAGGITPAGKNTFVGVNAGNLTMGSNATSTSQASYNTAMGYASLYANTTGISNNAIGAYSLRYNTTGSNNNAMGYYSLYNNTTGTNNNAMGAYSLRYNTTGTSNNAMGYYSLYDLEDGSSNTGVGYNTGRGITHGSGNTILGARVTGLDAGLTNNIILANGTGAIKARHDGTDWSLTGNVDLGANDLNTTGSVKGVHKAADGTSAVADGEYVMGIGATTNGTITIKDGLITSVTEAAD